MMDRASIRDWLRDVIDGNTRPDDTEMAKATLATLECLDLPEKQPPSDLTPYLTAAASDEELDRWSRAMWRTLGRALQSADAARGK
jgi:hypothetical protein